MLSSNAKLESLSDRIEDAAANERNGLRMISMGVVLAALGMVIAALVQNAAASLMGVCAVVLGTASAVCGFFVSVHYARRYNSLLNEVSSLEK